MNTKHASALLTRLAAPLLALGLLCSTLPAYASGKGEGGGGPAPMTFTANIGPYGPDSPTGGGVLQVTMVLQTGSPEAQHEVDTYKPKVTHHIYQTISKFTVSELRAPNGKDKLVDAIIDRLNAVLKLKPKDGITDVFFTSFIVQ